MVDYHSLKIEVSTRTYMDEAMLQKKAGFEHLKSTVDSVFGNFCGRARTSRALSPVRGAGRQGKGRRGDEGQ